MLATTVNHLLNNVIPAASDYEASEDALSLAYAADAAPASWVNAARLAKRRAAELAVAIDGLTDRASNEIALSKTSLRTSIAALCYWPQSSSLRPGSHDRVRAVANAYKHQNLSDRTLPISSDSDILVVGLGYGLDGFGVGKPGGVEVIVRETAGTLWKFLGDAPIAVGAWFNFLHAHEATLPAGPHIVCGLLVHP